MSITTSNNSSSLTLNTSAIAVPSVATMVQHLIDSDPHPQYILGTELTSIVKSSVNVGDLADVSFGLGVPDSSIMVYQSGAWKTMTVSTLVSSMGSASIEVHDTNVSAHSALMASKANLVDFNNHVDNSNVHVTSADKNNWNMKANSTVVSAVSSTVVNNGNVTYSAFAKLAVLKEDTVEMVQSNASVPASALVTGHVITAYDDNNIQVYPTVAYSNGSSIITNNFSSAVTKNWTVVHTEAVGVTVSSGILSI